MQTACSALCLVTYKSVIHEHAERLCCVHRHQKVSRYYYEVVIDMTYVEDVFESSKRVVLLYIRSWSFQALYFTITSVCSLYTCTYFCLTINTLLFTHQPHHLDCVEHIIRIHSAKSNITAWCTPRFCPWSCPFFNLYVSNFSIVYPMIMVWSGLIPWCWLS